MVSFFYNKKIRKNQNNNNFFLTAVYRVNARDTKKRMISTIVAREIQNYTRRCSFCIAENHEI